jgi:hypothetical protein
MYYGLTETHLQVPFGVSFGISIEVKEYVLFLLKKLQLQLQF